MDRKTVTAQLRSQFYPVLLAEGFSRKGDILRRELDGPVVHVRWGSVGLHVHVRAVTARLCTCDGVGRVARAARAMGVGGLHVHGRGS